MKETYLIQEIFLEHTYTQLWQDIYIPVFNAFYIYSSNL